VRANPVLFSRAVAVGALSLSGLTLATLAVTSAVGATGKTSRVSPAATDVRPPSGVEVLGWGFEQPAAIASDGTEIWVASAGGNSVTELSASRGTLVKVIGGASCGFHGPTAVASNGTEIWAANFWGNFVTELSAS